MTHYRLIRDIDNNLYTLQDVTARLSSEDWYETIEEALQSTMCNYRESYANECADIAKGHCQVIVEFKAISLLDQFREQHPELLI